jgi:hypothetical protein
MKEQEDIQQDFDRWLFDQLEEETFVPSTLDRSLLWKKLRFRKTKQIWIVGLTLCLGFVLFYIGFFMHSPKPEKKKSHRENDVSIPNRMPVVPIESIPRIQSGLILPVKFHRNNHLMPSGYESFENVVSVEVPPEKSSALSNDSIPRSHTYQVDLDTVMKNLGIFYLQSSTSNNGEAFAGVTSRHELVMAHVMDGSLFFPISPDTLSMQGGFRPIGMSENQYVEYAFYDVRQLLFNEAIYRQVLAVNVLPRIAYYMRTSAPGWNNPVNMHVYQDLPQARTNAQRYQDQNIRRIAGQEELKNQSPSLKSSRSFYLRQNVRVNNMAKVGLLIGDNFLIKSQGEKILVVSCDAERVSIVAQNGVIQASHSISIEYPRYFSQKAKCPFYDEASQRLYLIVETNFAYMWYEVDQMSGKSRYIFKTETIWNDPKWTISDGVLTYVFKGKTYRHPLN